MSGTASKGVLKIFANFTGKHVLDSILNKVAGPKRLQHRGFFKKKVLKTSANDYFWYASLVENKSKRVDWCEEIWFVVFQRKLCVNENNFFSLKTLRIQYDCLHIMNIKKINSTKDELLRVVIHILCLQCWATKIRIMKEGCLYLPNKNIYWTCCLKFTKPLSQCIYRK